jgi:putative molybdopterin biosynthesis protein
MESHSAITSLQNLACLGDPERQRILRLLMAGPATLTQLAKQLGTYPAQVRHHLKQLEAAGFVSLDSTRQVRGFVEKYYRAAARVYLLQAVLLPETPGREALIFSGSHDLAVEMLAHNLLQAGSLPELFVLPVGSLDGLIALRQGVCHLAGAHLLDAESGAYNMPFVQRILPDRAVRLVTLSHRQQGLLLRQGNPRRIQGLADLARPEVTFINRRRGAGTRLWLDQRLHSLGIRPEQVRGYGREALTHSQVAEAVASGQADVGLGVLAAARQQALDFIPLFEERYDLVFPVELVENKGAARLLDYITSLGYRRAVEALGGYRTAHTGENVGSTA